jgi:hypothetical protein
LVEVLRAELDLSNYRQVVDPETGEPAFEFAYPTSVQERINAYRRSTMPSLQSLVLPF